MVGLTRVRRTGSTPQVSIIDNSDPPISKTRIKSSIPITETTPKDHRKSSISSLKIPSLPLRTSGKRKNSEPVIERNENVIDSNTTHGFLRLPAELQVEIVKYLQWKDLARLRSLSFAFNELVTDSSSAIAMFWISQKLHPFSRLLFQPPEAPELMWRYIVEQTRRWSVARNLAKEVGKYVRKENLLYAVSRKSMQSDPVASRIHRKMAPLLFLVSHHLSHAQRTLMYLEADMSAEDLQQKFIQRSMNAISNFSYIQVYATHGLWLFMLWLVKQILGRPSYAGSVERTIRGWRSEPLDQTALPQMLLHGNLSAIKQCLRLDSYANRRKWVERFLKTLDPQMSTRWKDNWKNLDLSIAFSDGACQPTKEQVTALLQCNKIGLEHLWIPAADRVLGERYGKPLKPSERWGSAEMTVQILGGLAGYDLVHQNPPQWLLEEESRIPDEGWGGRGMEEVAVYDEDDEVIESSEGVDDGIERTGSADSRGSGGEAVPQSIETSEVPTGSNYWDV